MLNLEISMRYLIFRVSYFLVTYRNKRMNERMKYTLLHIKIFNITVKKKTMYNIRPYC